MSRKLASSDTSYSHKAQALNLQLERSNWSRNTDLTSSGIEIHVA